MKIIFVIACIAALVCTQELTDELIGQILQDIAYIQAGIPLETPPLAASEFPEDHVTFSFYTRNNPNDGIVVDGQHFKSLDVSKPTKFLVHGYLEHQNRPYYSRIRDEYLKKYDCNIIFVDWSIPAFQRYGQSAANTRRVGEIIASFLINSKISPKNVHLIGHSMGGQTVGFAGKMYQNFSGGQKIARISALDPARPLFESFLIKDSERLHKTDAEMVDILHTDGGVFGYLSSHGTVDFYANGGTRVQPGCLLSFDEFIDMITCSHTRSHLYFTESINSQKFQSKKCLNYQLYKTGLCDNTPSVVYGDDTPKDVTGNYYFETNSTSPNDL